MKIYFAGSICGGRENSHLYSKIIAYLKKYGSVLTEHVGNPGLTYLGEKGSPEAIYKRNLKRLQEADVIIAEISTPSLGVGYEVAKAEELKKPILCLYKKQNHRRLSAMLGGNKNLIIKEYKNLDEGLRYIDEFLGRYA